MPDHLAVYHNARPISFLTSANKINWAHDLPDTGERDCYDNLRRLAPKFTNHLALFTTWTKLPTVRPWLHHFQHLNTEQQLAFERACEEGPSLSHKITIIKVPPGTGKTRVERAWKEVLVSGVLRFVLFFFLFVLLHFLSGLSFM